ncbi:DUF7352 domain-containing protein [Spartinivicinus poritis]|uniref:DUF7352 domain-containing protein n=1 Tax=Spartinivicinus poritis TaxID=2994640 RepID=A0ABT5UHK1_9GAMM|nr:hypothetical protein [Spartinivicinus sp. A2-2]MDE1465690.1 hypothetical protein [Spartinivicinus sp. A2-2]
MKTIHKYLLEDGMNTLTLKQGYRIVRSEYLLVEKAVYLWIEESLAITTPESSCQFKVVKTNAPIPENYKYLDTALDPIEAEAYHVYQIPSDAESKSKPQDQSREVHFPQRMPHKNVTELLQQVAIQ